jgi:hypothetical protein
MKDPLQQFARLRQQLIEEKSQLEARLGEITQVLGVEIASSQAPQITTHEAPSRPVARRERGRADNEMSLREAVLKALSAGPRTRKELVNAVEEVGYVFHTANPLNSIGSVLYGKNTPVKSKGGKFYLPGGVQTEIPEHNGGGAAGDKRKGKRSEEARARMSAAQKARWARLRRSK